MTNKIVHIIGGGTIAHVRTHLALTAPAFGGTARRLAELCKGMDKGMEVALHLTKMADPQSNIVTNEDLKTLVLKLVDDRETKIVFFNPAVVDFNASVGDVASTPDAKRLRTQNEKGEPLSYDAVFTPAPKLIHLFRNGGEGRSPRKDIFLVGFKATSGATAEEQYRQGLHMLKASSANLVLANDVLTKLNIIIVPEEATYSVTTDRNEALRTLVEMAYARSRLTFTRSTVVAGEPVEWRSELVPASLRAVVDHCISRGAYKKFRGVTAGHFAVKVDETTFLTSRRKTDFNEMEKVGLVKVESNGPDSVIAYGSRPSVGGQSQRIIFSEHPEADCIVHFHSKKKEGSMVPTVSQREFECGSHECGQNTSRGLRRFGELLAVDLDQHGPNIIFNRSIDPRKVIEFIESNFNIGQKTGGYAIA